MIMDTTYLLDNFVTTKPGEAYRLFPFGRLVKNGKAREITAEYAARFKLPHFKPPVKLGSHKEETPAGGHILSLEVRQDGLYAIPALNEKGETALTEGHYRYHSPEVIWDDGYLENPANGERIQGPLIVGDALLHMPHLGEAAALYSIDVMKGDETMSDGTMTVPASWVERFDAWLDRLARNENQSGGQSPNVPDDYAALQAKAAEVDLLASRIATMEAEQAKRARLDRFSAEVGKTKAAKDGAAEHLASMTDEQAEWVLRQFTALSAQIDESALLGERGAAGGGPVVNDPAHALNAAVTAKMSEKGLPWLAAFEVVKVEQPDLFAAYAGGK